VTSIITGYCTVFYGPTWIVSTQQPSLSCEVCDLLTYLLTRRNSPTTTNNRVAVSSRQTADNARAHPLWRHVRHSPWADRPCMVGRYKHGEVDWLVKSRSTVPLISSRSIWRQNPRGQQNQYHQDHNETWWGLN